MLRKWQILADFPALRKGAWLALIPGNLKARHKGALALYWLQSYAASRLDKFLDPPTLLGGQDFS